MTTTMLGRCLCVLCLLLTAGGWGCAGSSRYMREVPATTPIAARADRAVVVFVRPSGVGFLVNFTILDRQGNWVGDSVAESHFAIELPPGDYMFIGWAENSAALMATLAPGRVYFVEVIPVLGVGSSRVALEGLSPRHEDWPNVTRWMAETKRTVQLPKGERYYRSRHDDVMNRIASANENWRDYSEAEKAKRSLRAEDGVPTGGQPAPMMPAAPPGSACVSDNQCAGQAVCENGACVPPAPPPSVAPACGADRDCPGAQICEAGTCKEPGAAAGGLTPPPPAGEANKQRCGKDADCEGDLVCIDAACVRAK